MLRGLHFLFRSFSSLLLITSPWIPQRTGSQLGLPQHLSARGSSFRMAHLKCSPTQPGSNSVIGPWSCLPSYYPCVAWGLLLAKPGHRSRWEHTTISFPFFCPLGLSHRVCVPTVFGAQLSEAELWVPSQGDTALIILSSTSKGVSAVPCNEHGLGVQSALHLQAENQRGSFNSLTPLVPFN